MQAYMVGSDVMIPERRHSTRSVSIEPGQIRCECYTNDVIDDGQHSANSSLLFCNLWNKLPENIKTVGSYNLFRKRLKQHYLELI